MRRRDDTLVPPRRRRRYVPAALAVVATFGLAGCGEDLKRGYLPKGATEGAQRVTDLWVGGWIAALVVGVIVWGLTIWCIVAYRRKKDDVGLPPQLRYNVPIEILYTVLPIMMIGVLFYYTARDEAILLDTSPKPDVKINVVGKRWSWDFNYLDHNVYDSGAQLTLTGRDTDRDSAPVLYVPVNQRIEFVLTARDVIHSFWVPAFQQKLDMIPGKVNKFQVVTTEKGEYDGKCAELCGSYHASMLFKVKVVEEAEYLQQMAKLKAEGKTGFLDNGYSMARLDDNQVTIEPKVGK